MAIIFSNSIVCQELFTKLNEKEWVMLGTLVNAASGIDPNRIYQYQTKPSLTYVLRNGGSLGLNDDDWDFYINIKRVGSDTCTVLSGVVAYSTDEFDDPVFQYEWQYGDTSVTGNYEAQYFAVYISNSKQIVFDKATLVIRAGI